jgi:hypothetical protein
VVEHRERATDVLSDEIESASGPYEHLGIVRGRLDRPPNEIERFAPVGLGILHPVQLGVFKCQILQEKD